MVIIILLAILFATYLGIPEFLVVLLLEDVFFNRGRDATDRLVEMAEKHRGGISKRNVVKEEWRSE